MGMGQQTSPMIDPRMTEQPKRGGGIFGRQSALWKVLGTLGDGLTGNPAYGQMQMQERNSLMQQEQERQKMQMQQQQRMDDRSYEESEWTRRQEYERNNPKPAQATEFERILQASSLPEAQKIQLLNQYAQNKANPLQGVPYTDAQGNTGIQFIRPGQMQQTAAPGEIIADPRKKGGPVLNAPGGF